MRACKIPPRAALGPRYDRDALTSDLVAAVIVTIMLIPQSLAYALLAGLPPEVGIYASIAPIILYAVFGTSRALAVGPVAVVSLMTAAAVGRIAEGTRRLHRGGAHAGLSVRRVPAAGRAAAGVSRQLPLAPGDCRLHHRIGLIIAASQLKHMLGIKASGHNLFESCRWWSIWAAPT
jgi:SulP family sulfate permease